MHFAIPGRAWTRVEGSKDLGGDRVKDSDAVVERPHRVGWPEADLLSSALGQGGGQRAIEREHSPPVGASHIAHIQTED